MKLSLERKDMGEGYQDTETGLVSWWRHTVRPFGILPYLPSSTQTLLPLRQVARRQLSLPLIKQHIPESQCTKHCQGQGQRQHLYMGPQGWGELLKAPART